jgi:PhnB protein
MFKLIESSRRRFIASAGSAVLLAALPVPLRTNLNTQKTRREAMTCLTPYLLFDGNCHEAMQFYKLCLGGELTVMKVKDSPAKDHMPASQFNKTINAHLKGQGLEISASDWLRLDTTPIRGNTICLYLSGGTFHDLKALFDKLSEGAEITDPL